jgi:predicted fused transcriptional regulator/phosphomethylpyrimidine kinase
MSVPVVQQNVSTCLPFLVAGDGHVVDVLGEVVRRGSRIRLVVEGPVGARAVVFLV